MAAATQTYPHLMFDPEGMPVIEREGFKAIHLVREHLAYGWSAEELALNHPQLRLGEIYSVLAWYADHAAEVDGAIQASLEKAQVQAERPEFRRLSRRLRES
ncbi:MAG: hypothetical protein KDM64_11215 [Verrucomicrobiae bacterium]|nr:hypothetical protein [Verrucomicrobiae bacterium]MCB1091860.1 hypothetical protein [Verrucomicrobiae bacterium]